MLQILFAGAILLAIVYVFGPNLKKSSKRLPGPFKWPIVGNIGNIYFANPKYVHLALENLAKKYGDVMSLKFGVYDTVILSSFKAAKDLLVKDEFTDRQVLAFTTDRAFGKALGILFSSGEIWRESRKCAVKGLREFGFGKKKSMDHILREELKYFMLEIKNSSNANKGIVKIKNTFDLSLTNVIWSLIAGYRFSYDDETLRKMLSHNDKLLKVANYGNVYLAFPELRFWFPKLTGFNEHKKMYEELLQFAREIVDTFRSEMRNRIRDDLDDWKPLNFVEFLLKKQEEEIKNKNQNFHFSDEDILIILLDLFLAGSETTSGSLAFAVLYMTLHPHVQNKIQKEISEIEQDGSELSALDIQRMPYTKASVYEILRMSNIVPLPIGRRAMKDVYYREYFIPKDTIVMANVTTILHDKEFWGDPDVFRPERFLDERNNLVNTERVTCFGFGKRACLGESLALDSIFLYLTTLLRNFTLECVPGEPKPLLNDPTEGTATLSPKPFNVLFKSRI